MRCNSRLLLIITLAYIYIPIGIFLVGFTRLPICLITLGVCGYALYKMYKDYALCQSGRQFEVPVDGKQTEVHCTQELKISIPVLICCIVLIVAVCLGLGFGGVFYQPGDWCKHNAVLRDLVEREWPVTYSKYENCSLTYYLGQYLLPALIGKVSTLYISQNVPEKSFSVASFAMAVWGILGLILVYLNLVRITVSDKAGKQFRLLWIMFFFCGALPLAQVVCTGLFGDNSYSLGANHWLIVNDLLLQYRSNLIMIRWVYPQVIVIWLIVILFIENSQSVKHYVILLAPILLYGTFAVVVMGAVAVSCAVVSVIVSEKKSEAVRNILSISNIGSFITLGAILIAYFGGYLGVEKPEYISFGMQNLTGGNLVAIVIFTFFMYGIYAICVFEEQKKNVIFYCMSTLLFFIPFFKMGLCNDWVMGTSIPALFMLMIYVVDFLNKKETRLKEPGRKHAYSYGVKYALVIAVLLIGAWYPLVELKDNVVGQTPGGKLMDTYVTMENFTDRNSGESIDLIYNYFTYDMEETFFYKYIAKRENGYATPQNSVNGIYFDTYVSITTYDSTSYEVLQEALEKCAAYEAVFDRNAEVSEVYKWNNSEDGKVSPVDEGENEVSPVDEGENEASPSTENNIALSPDLNEVVRAGLEYNRLTDGRFDIALGNVTGLWDFHSDNPSVPESLVIDEALRHSGCSHLKYENERLYKDDADVQLDLGGIAKGYIADEIRDFLVERGCSSAVIALGGNIVVIGDKGGQGFNVGITDPFDKAGVIEEVCVSDTSVVTSGVYERCFEKDGISYHHILDPQTGYPAETDLVSVTIVGDDSMEADALATAVLMMGEEQGKEFVESLLERNGSGTIKRALLVNKDRQIVNVHRNE